MNIQSVKKNDGYTLVEALVAIAILTSILLGVLMLATQSIRATNVAKTKLEAEYLAQEGIEFVRAMREDTSDYFQIPYATLVTQSATGAVQLNADSAGHMCFATSDFDNPTCPGAFGTLYQDSAQQNRFVVACDTTQQGSICTPSVFSRAITFTAKTDTDNVRYYEVTSEVTFTIAGFANPQKYSLTTELYNVAP